MKLSIKGDIIGNDYKGIYDYLKLDACCPRDVTRAIDDCADGEELEVEISSGGGSVVAGSEIYTALTGYKKGALSIRVTGIAASAASVIAMAGHCEMSRTALMMIHNASTVARGDHQEMERAAEVLRAADEAIAAAYIRKTGKSAEELAAMMDRETWITAEKAVEMGFADGIIGDEAEPDLAIAAAGTNTLSEETLKKLRGLIEKTAAESKHADNGTDAIARAEADYNFMLLKGAQR